MELLRLYDSAPLEVVEKTAPLCVSSQCTLCNLHERVRSSCMRAEGDSGGVLLVGDYPGAEEDRTGIPFSGPTGKYLRKLVARWWSGPVAYDNALRCFPGERPTSTAMVDSCRGYLAATIREVKPTVIVAMGGRAIYGVLGRTLPLQSVRRGYGWLYNTDIDPISGMPIPVFELINPVNALRNRFIRISFEEDLKAALSGAPLMQPPWGGVVSVVETYADACAAASDLRAAEWLSFDCETIGVQYHPDFRNISMACCARGSDHSYAWDSRALRDKELVAPLLDLLKDDRVKKIGSNLKYDAHSVACEYHVTLRNHFWDTRLCRKLLDADADASLEVMCELVGMGGMKKEAEDALIVAVRQIVKARVACRKSLLFPFENPVILAACKRVDVEPKRYAFGLLARKILLRYNARDAVSTARLGVLLGDRLEETPPVKRIWTKVVRGASYAIQRVEEWGMPVSRDSVELFIRRLEIAASSAALKFNGYPNFNPRSSQSVLNLLFGQLHLKPVKLLVSGASSTDQDSLKELAGSHPVVDALIEYRRLDKLLGFARGLQEHISPDGRIHPSINIDGARTGRTSCIAKGTPIEVLRDVAAIPAGVPIEQVSVGDWVWTYSIDGTPTLRRVVRVFANGARRIARVHWRGQGGYSRGFLDLTPDHRVRMMNGTYVRAADLKCGDRISAVTRNVTNSGYARLYFTGVKHAIREHCRIGEFLRGGPFEHCHHVDGNKLNNVPHNIVGMDAIAHLTLHANSIPEGLRVRRSEVMRERHRLGRIRYLRGEENARWKRLTKATALFLLRANRWSISLAARSAGWDFATFRKHLTLLGFDCEEIKLRSRRKRRDSILRAAAFARSVRLGNNHIVESIEFLNRSALVYDLEIDGTHNYFAGGICVHNCSAPNLQNIARPRDPESKMARDLFVANPHHKLVSFDYSQLELRIASMMSGDPEMLAIWAAGLDYHQRTAELIADVAWGLRVDQLLPIHRDQSKTVNFGVLYGMAAKSLAKRIGCSKAQAAKILTAITGRFSRFAEWCQEQIEIARKTGYVYTWWEGEQARRRPLWGIADADDETRSNAERAALNTPIQGCIPGYTRITTDRGILKIADAPDQGRVWTGHEFAEYEKLNRGEWQLSIIALANGQMFHCDTRHSVLVVGENEYEFRAYKDLREGDLICLSLAQPIEFSSNGCDTELAYWLGYAIGNGYTCTSRGRNALAVTFGNRKGRASKEESANRFVVWAYSCGYVHQKPRVFKNKITVTICSPALRESWVALGYPWGANSHTKYTPTVVWSLSLKARRSYLLGLLDSDGTIGVAEKTGPCLHLCQGGLLRETQILARTCCVESVYRELNDGSFRLDFNGGQLHEALDYGYKRKKIVVRDCAPRFVIKEFLHELSVRERVVWSSSDQVLISRFRKGGSTSVYKLYEMCKKIAVPIRLYAASELVSKRASRMKETTWTLAVKHSGHRFDSEGVISKNTSSEYCVASIASCVQWIEDDEPPAKVVLAVHDDIIFEVEDSAVDEVVYHVPKIMTGWDSGVVPLEVSIKVGQSWGSMQKYQ